MVVTNTAQGTNYSTETQEVRNGAGALSDRTTEVYQHFDWGYELIAVTNDPGGANLVTSFTFNPNTNDLASGGKMISIVYPDGFWERRTYSPGYDYYDDYWRWLNWPQGNLMRVVQPWKDSPISAQDNDCLVADYQYNADRPGNYLLQKWHDAAAAGEPTDAATGLENRNVSPVYQEETWYDTDPCSDSPSVLVETRQLGNLQHYGEFNDTKTFPPYYGRLSGQLYSKESNLEKLDSYDYEFGFWDSDRFVFTPSDTNTNDVRQTIFHGAYFSWAESYDQLYQGPSGASIEPVLMEPNRSTKEVRIIHGGNLVAKETYVYQGGYTSFALLNQVIDQRDALGHATNVVRIDPATHQVRVVYKADWTGTGTWPADLKLSETDESGTVYTYSYDSLQRVQTKVKQAVAGQSAITTTLAYDAANRVLTNKVSAGSLAQSTTTHFDLAGRKTNETDVAGLTTTYAYQNNGRKTIITASSGATSILNNFLDRRPASITGSAVTNQFFDYKLTAISSFDCIEAKNVTLTTLGTSNSLRWSAQVTDTRYQQAEVLKPAFGQSYNLPSGTFLDEGASGLWCRRMFWAGTTWAGFYERDLDASPWAGTFLSTYWLHDALLERTLEARPGQDIVYGGYDTEPYSGLARVTTWTNFYQAEPSGWFHVTEQWTYANYGTWGDNGPATLVERTRERMTGFTATGVSETQFFDADTNQTTVAVSVNLATRTVTTTTNVASSLTATEVAANGLVQSASSTSVAQPTLFYYDALGRQTGVKDSLGNLTGTQSEPFTGQVTATTDAFGRATTYDYYPAGGTNAGLLKCQTGPTGRKTSYNYDGCGRLIQTWGDVPYPEQRQYNQFGDLDTLTTYRGGSGWSGSSWPSTTGTGDVTHWYYDEPTGLLTAKADAAGKSVTYDYYGNGLPKTRTWARGLSSTNLYEVSNNDLVRIAYSDGSSVFFTNADFPVLNRRGKPDVVVDAAGTSLLTYDHAERVVSTAYSGGLLAGITVTNHFNGLYGRDALAALSAGNWQLGIGYGYDGYGRLGTVSSDIYSAQYDYLPNSDLLLRTTCKNNGSAVLTTTRTWETGPRLRSIANTTNGAAVTSHSYLYDSLDRRIQATLEDGSIWKYRYNDRNELMGANRYWSDWSPVAGQQYGYDYDTIGNRKSANFGGDVSGGGLQQTSYTANNLNEYLTVTTPGCKDICGAAFATNGVVVNGGSADRKIEYFHRQVGITNTGGPLWQDVTVASGGVTNKAGLVFPASSQALTYDTDGNLTFDGVWTYQWDCENRLVAMTMTNVANVAATNRLRLQFVYDIQGRRVQKKVSHWNGGPWVLDSDSRFIYDGWNLIAILNAQSSILQSFMWGLDLSGTEEGAGGVGGLLAVFEMSNGQVSNSHSAAYDGNGNVTALVKGSDSSVSARYEYSPHGETLRATGFMAAANPFGWSTKARDQESELVLYGYRYYLPAAGRWINRDPIEEQGGLNLYVFVANSPINGLDPHGQFLLVDFGLSSVLRSMSRGSMISGGLSGSIAAVNKIGFGKGTWGGVGKTFVQGLVVGALTGGAGKFMGALAKGVTATGENGALLPAVGAFIGGVNGAIGYMSGEALGGKNLRKQLSTPEGITGFAVTVVVGSVLGGVASHAEDNGVDGLSLDVALGLRRCCRLWRRYIRI